MALSTKAKKRFEAAMAKRAEAQEIIAAIEAGELSGWTSLQIAAMNSGHVNALSVAQLISLSSQQLRAIEVKDIAGLTTDQIAGLDSGQTSSLTTSQFSALSNTQIRALSSNNVEAWTSSQLIALNSVQIRAFTSRVSPVPTKALSYGSRPLEQNLSPALLTMHTKLRFRRLCLRHWMKLQPPALVSRTSSIWLTEPVLPSSSRKTSGRNAQSPSSKAIRRN
jgi:hypothetical protein